MEKDNQTYGENDVNYIDAFSSMMLPLKLMKPFGNVYIYIYRYIYMPFVLLAMFDSRGNVPFLCVWACRLADCVGGEGGFSADRRLERLITTVHMII